MERRWDSSKETRPLQKRTALSPSHLKNYGKHKKRIRATEKRLRCQIDSQIRSVKMWAGTGAACCVAPSTEATAMTVESGGTVWTLSNGPNLPGV